MEILFWTLSFATSKFRKNWNTTRSYCHLVWAEELATVTCLDQAKNCVCLVVTGILFSLYVKFLLPTNWNFSNIWGSVSWIAPDIELAQKTKLKNWKNYREKYSETSFRLSKKIKRTDLACGAVKLWITVSSQTFFCRKWRLTAFDKKQKIESVREFWGKRWKTWMVMVAPKLKVLITSQQLNNWGFSANPNSDKRLHFDKEKGEAKTFGNSTMQHLKL